jgi:hypothetical protein
MVLRAVSNPVVTQSLQEYSEHAEVHYCHVKMFWQFISSCITIFSSSWFFMNQRQHNTSQLTFLSLHSLCSEPTRFSKRPWLMAGAGLFWKKSTAGWWLISRANMLSWSDLYRALLLPFFTSSGSGRLSCRGTADGTSLPRCGLCPGEPRPYAQCFCISRCLESAHHRLVD